MRLQQLSVVLSGSTMLFFGIPMLLLHIGHHPMPRPIHSHRIEGNAIVGAYEGNSRRRIIEARVRLIIEVVLVSVLPHMNEAAAHLRHLACCREALPRLESLVVNGDLHDAARAVGDGDKVSAGNFSKPGVVFQPAKPLTRLGRRPQTSQDDRAALAKRGPANTLAGQDRPVTGGRPDAEKECERPRQRDQLIYPC